MNYNSIYFGQGDARIYLSDFESYHKFTISNVDPNTGAVIPIDLSVGVVSIAFKDAVGNMIKFPAEASDNLNASSKGDIVFKVPDYVRKKVLTDGSVKPFYIVTEAEGSPETVIYSGTVDNIENVSKENARVKDIVSVSDSLTSMAKAGDSATSSSTTRTSNNDTASASSASQSAGGLQSLTNQPGDSILKTLTDANSAAIDSIKASPEVKPPVIPNFNFDPGAASVKNGITPVSSSKESESRSQVQARLTQKTDTTKTTLKK
jgi:hypothetical protein